MSTLRLSRYLGITQNKIKSWEDGKGEIPVDIAEKFASIAYTNLSEFCSKNITAEEIMNKRFAFDAKSTFEIEKKYEYSFITSVRRYGLLIHGKKYYLPYLIEYYCGVKVCVNIVENNVNVFDLNSHKLILSFVL